ncbi:MAG: histidine triad nucleotide-binding protein [Proteobacteria bacterium]|nr:histidine triad nucleotide-binding protein [Pseudomonadota bacterium]
MPSDCIFCKIVNKEIPSAFLFENDALVVFKDINPQAPVHLLIVPRKHIRSINDLKDEDRSIISEMIFSGRNMAKTFKTDTSGYKLFFNVEKGGGQEVFHLHLHLIGGFEK